jgi:hypothetical protein
MMARLLRRAGQAGLLALAAVLAACGGGGDTPSANGVGQLAIRLTDAQGCDYRSVWVTVERVRIHRSATAGEADGGWQDLYLSPARRVDLLTLRNGVFVDLGTMPLPAGTYTQLRLVLAGNNGNQSPYANQLDLADGSPMPLSTPSGPQSGLKLDVDVEVLPGQLGELVLDFDPCKSVVRAGRSGRHNLKPVIRAHVNPVRHVEGYTLPGAVVSAQQGGVDVKSTTAGADGRFVLWPIEAGIYDLVITRADRASTVLAAVQVSGDRTVVGDAGMPLLPPAGAIQRRASGTVTIRSPGVDLVDARLRALQSMGTYEGSAVPLVIETASAAADAESGTYALPLQTAAPVRAFWRPGATTYTFEPFAAEAGRHVIEATAAGFAQPQTRTVALVAADGSSADAVAVDFSFPAP